MARTEPKYLRHERRGACAPPRKIHTVPPGDDPASLSDEQLVDCVKEVGAEHRARYVEELYGRYYSQVSAWCTRICGRRVEAADLAQEVFMKVHTRLHTFRGDSRFSTWLYTVTRHTAINRGRSAQRKQERELLHFNAQLDGRDPRRSADETLIRRESARRLRHELERSLDALEMDVLYLHFVDGLTLPAITRLLELSNKSGAKAYIVSAKRKLHRRVGRLQRLRSVTELASFDPVAALLGG